MLWGGASLASNLEVNEDTRAKYLRFQSVPPAFEISDVAS